MEGKSNEIPALPKLLDLLDVKSRVVTADAMHAQLETAAVGVARSGDYAPALKGKQETLHGDVAEYFDNPPKPEKVFAHQEVGKGHGRVERRTARVCHEFTGCKSAMTGPASRSSARACPLEACVRGSG